jgi:hypothetical protein
MTNKLISNLLNDRIGRLKDWEQIESLNEILFDALSSLNEHIQERFDGLTREIRDESALNNEPPVIKIAVCTEENIDKQLFTYPVATEPPLKSPGYITTVFAECDYYTIRKLTRQTYTAHISGKTGACQAKVALRYSEKYLQKLQSLYFTFSENELPWATVNGIYFYKFLDVFCEKDIQQEIGKIESFDIDFGPNEKHISYDKVLLWNVNPVSAPVAECEARPAYNAIQFEHTIKNLQLDEHRYIVCPFGERFTCFRRGPKMFVRTYTSQLEQINLLRIIGGEDAESPLFLPPKSNRKKVSLINTLARGRYIPTRGEAERIVYSLSEANLLLTDIKVLPYTEDNIMLYKGIEFNSFVESKTFLTDKKKLLLFTFKSGDSNLWAHETMYFALSELQLYFYEYRCLGQLL